MARQARCPYPEKHRYASRKAARRGAILVENTRASGGGRMVVYPCQGHWHVGHKRVRG